MWLEQEIQRCNAAGFEGGGRGSWGKECGWILEAAKGKEKYSSLEPPKRKAAGWHLNFRSVKPTSDFRPTNCRIIHICCFIYLFFTRLLEYSCFIMCVSFCCITKWISYMYTYSSHPLPLASPSHPPYPTPLGGHKTPSLSPCATRLFPTSYLFYIW